MTRQRERGSSAANSDVKQLPSDFSFDELGIDELGTMFTSLGSGSGGLGMSIGSRGNSGGPFAMRMGTPSPIGSESAAAAALSPPAAVEAQRSGDMAVVPLFRRDSAEAAREMVRTASDAARGLGSSSAKSGGTTSTAAIAPAAARAAPAARVVATAPPRAPQRSSQPKYVLSPAVIAAAAAAAEALSMANEEEPSIGPDGKPIVRKQRKNMREKQRREEVSASFNALTELLDLQTTTKFKCNKVTVLTTAVAEIEALRVATAQQQREIAELRAQLAAAGGGCGGGGRQRPPAQQARPPAQQQQQQRQRQRQRQQQSQQRPALKQSLGSDDDMRAVIADLAASGSLSSYGT